jgi:hypothetical protein
LRSPAARVQDRAREQQDACVGGVSAHCPARIIPRTIDRFARPE